MRKGVAVLLALMLAVVVSSGCLGVNKPKYETFTAPVNSTNVTVAQMSLTSFAYKFVSAGFRCVCVQTKPIVHVSLKKVAEIGSKKGAIYYDGYNVFTSGKVDDNTTVVYIWTIPQNTVGIVNVTIENGTLRVVVQTHT